MRSKLDFFDHFLKDFSFVSCDKESFFAYYPFFFYQHLQIFPSNTVIQLYLTYNMIFRRPVHCYSQNIFGDLISTPFSSIDLNSPLDSKVIISKTCFIYI